MKLTKIAAALAASVVFSSAAVADERSFSAVQGIEAETMSAVEMNAVYGQITIDEIKAAVIAKVANPRLEALILAQIDRLVAQYPARVQKVLALLTRYGL